MCWTVLFFLQASSTKAPAYLRQALTTEPFDFSTVDGLTPTAASVAVNPDRISTMTGAGFAQLTSAFRRPLGQAYRSTGLRGGLLSSPASLSPTAFAAAAARALASSDQGGLLAAYNYAAGVVDSPSEDSLAQLRSIGAAQMSSTLQQLVASRPRSMALCASFFSLLSNPSPLFPFSHDLFVACPFELSLRNVDRKIIFAGNEVVAAEQHHLLALGPRPAAHLDRGLLRLLGPRILQAGLLQKPSPDLSCNSPFSFVAPAFAERVSPCSWKPVIYLPN